MKGILQGTIDFFSENYVGIIFVLYVFITWVFIKIMYNIEFKQKKKFKVKKVMVIERFDNNKYNFYK